MTKLFLNRDPSLPDLFWREIHLQAYCVMELRRLGYIVHGDANGASKTIRGRMQSQIGGAQKGWPDLTIIAPDGKLFWVELKLDAAISKEQKELHAEMQKRGHNVHVVKALTPSAALDKIMEIIL